MTNAQGEKIDMGEKMKDLEKRKKLASKKLVLPEHILLCPFQSSPDEEVSCSPRCAIFQRNKKQGYNCPFTELISIGWVLKGSPTKKKPYDPPKYNPYG